MKIQDELVTRVINNQQQLKKAEQAQAGSNFAALFADELTQGQGENKVQPGIKGIDPLATLTGLTEIRPTTEAMFSAEENQVMDDISDLLNSVDTYSLALAGNGNGQTESGLKSVYNLLDTIANKAQDLKGVLAKMSDNPVLAGVVNELEVMAATEKFKLNRGDYTI